MITFLPPPARSQFLERDLNGNFTGLVSTIWINWLSEQNQKVAEVSGSVEADRVAGEFTGVSPADTGGLDESSLLGQTRTTDLPLTALFAELRPVPDFPLDGMFGPRGPGSTARIIQDTAANIGLYPAAAYAEALYIETDTRILRRSDGTGWTQVNPFDDVYGSGWNGSLKAPTQNAVYDEIQTVIASIPVVRVLPLFDHFADAANVTTGVTTLYTDTLPAGQFSANGDKVVVEYGGKFVSSATATREIWVKFDALGTSTVLDTGALTLSLSSQWTCYLTLMRKDSTTVRWMVSFETEGAGLAAYTSTGELTGLPLTGTMVLTIVAQAAGVGAASGDITAQIGSAVWFKAA